LGTSSNDSAAPGSIDLSDAIEVLASLSAIENRWAPDGDSELRAAYRNGDDHEKQSAAILVVEDSPADVLLIRETLKGLPIKLVVARDGEEALTVLADESRRPDLIILDLNLPKLDGFGVLEQYRPALVPIVIFSSTQNTTEAQRALSLGAREFVHKPIEFPDFVSAVEGIIARFLPGVVRVA
jgi:CheY-like chemotaxis protein